MRRLSLTELVEFNDMLAGTVRGNAPLPDAIRLAQEGAGRRQRELQQFVLDRLERGQSLSAALAERPDLFDPRYQQVVAAGEEGNHLGAVLEAFSRYLWQLIELRRSLSRALLYPLLVTCIGYVLFVFVGGITTSRFVSFYRDTPMPLTPVLSALNVVYSNILYWVWIPPLILLLSWISWMYRRSGQLQLGRAESGVLSRLPGVGRALRLHRLANFTEIIALLLNENVPFAKSMYVAAHASGDAELIALSREPEALPAAPKWSVPPFLRWLLELSSGNHDVAKTMQHAGRMYRRRAEVASEWVRLLAPVLFLVFGGGAFTFLYVMTVFYPFTEMLFRL
ncbi:type II secretion system F family protein [Rubinisphaera brasiliensis]|uniref:Type II secretion system F domain protein n=1 Tax=Rubinisphaera brasiliensis (strain ATCC 49424 / DSM 5305 / JCM 21570 / IAM 15109 / NBRC 103401 / IFAM 1448) TaxID=756272 RepID=F0STE2_RUBBR|nr:type II secretion system F family protein [Rubinisphaera brasiliensis]ADY60404.1 Type II secretion system F domain protein [Rubinisphaera brasiliensis DSM 5305]